jgi:hypothetical protein
VDGDVEASLQETLHNFIVNDPQTLRSLAILDRMMSDHRSKTVAFKCDTFEFTVTCRTSNGQE